jgi:hypothetical protein
MAQKSNSSDSLEAKLGRAVRPHMAEFFHLTPVYSKHRFTDDAVGHLVLREILTNKRVASALGLCVDLHCRRMGEMFLAHADAARKTKSRS